MTDLEKRQREMRERMKQQPQRKKASVNSDTTLASQSGAARSPGVADLVKLEERVAALESENAELRTENERLRRQKTVYVERQKSAEEERRERVHNYFKYSNARRW